MTGRERVNLYNAASNAACWQVYVVYVLFNFSKVYIFPYFDFSIKAAYLLTPRSSVLLEKITVFSASQEIPRVLRYPKVHYRTHKCPPPVTILLRLLPVSNCTKIRETMLEVTE